MTIAACSRPVGVAVLIGGTLLTTGGCSIFAPHVQPEPQPEADTPAPELEETRPAKVASIDRAMKRAGGVDPQSGLGLCEEDILAEEFRRDCHRAVRWN